MAVQHVVQMPKADWDRLHVRLGRRLAEQMGRHGLTVVDSELGEQKPEDLTNYLVGTLAYLLITDNEDDE